MSRTARARDAGLACGSLPVGTLNSIADVPGVLVGHRTLIDGDGVTAERLKAAGVEVVTEEAGPLPERSSG